MSECTKYGSEFEVEELSTGTERKIEDKARKNCKYNERARIRGGRGVE